MDVNKAILHYKKIRSLLIFFCVAFVFSCNNNSNSTLNAEVTYQNKKAVSVAFSSTHMVKNLQMYLKGTRDTPVLGDFESANDGIIIFTPLIPFTPGYTYEIFHEQNKIRTFSIDPLLHSEKPTITAIYPSADTIPENLLKMYLVFSKPMQEVQNALDFIEVYNVTDDSATTIFLELQNELWNADHTKLTLWLDPGRIKTDLIPNRTKGIPLEEGKHYTVQISSEWKDAENNALDTTYVKHLYVGSRDNSKINLQNWKIKAPNQGTVDELILDVNEPLDAMLALETLTIVDAQNNRVDGVFKLAQKEKHLVFIPTKLWESGNYRTVVLSVLEDLAGNNLNHLFDKDLLLDAKSIFKEQYAVNFSID